MKKHECERTKSVSDTPGGAHPDAIATAAQDLPKAETILKPICSGRLASHELAPAFAAEVSRLLTRYVQEIVMRHTLCPFLKGVESGLGMLCVILDDELDIEGCAAVVRNAGTSVMHVVFPLIAGKPGDFERFGSAVHSALRGTMHDVPVQATFHPELVGARDTPHRLVGLLRQAPDPFIQFIPGNIQAVGTKAAGGPPTVPNTDRIFQDVSGEVLDTLLAQLADIRADRNRSYNKFRSAFGLPSNFPDPKLAPRSPFFSG